MPLAVRCVCNSSLTDTRKTDASANLGAGAIKAFDNIIIYGTGPGNYVGNSNKKASQLVDGEFPAWGNPIGEMFVQALSIIPAFLHRTLAV